MPLTEQNINAIAISVLETEIQALEDLKQYINQAFYSAVELMLNCQGKVIVIGMGKSGHIGNKIAATLASTGTPAFFVHPAEASHGDLGMIGKSDVILAISNSGETEEVVKILPVIKRLGCATISMTGNEHSSLAQESDHHICVKVEKEACPLGLAPTSSTTATLAMGDALAISLLEARDFTETDFAFSHPAGSLGRKLLLRVSDLMHHGDALPTVHQDTSIIKALLVISEKGMGFAAVLNDEAKLLGVYTDGDLRRSLDEKIDIYNSTLKEVVKPGCITIKPQMLAAEALALMEEKAINGLLVVDDSGQLVGALNMHDLLKAKVL
ncbi:KpsF/GutQ family sugar-phosphate isomerase [Catenovulum sp. SM1970]|uniref:KpsF/GutQ family sugar-phosphate isomerase n=1 Tax=Marinifaba aquimaris TaxID=2741323 RepID=UPI0015722366|nr:KpsF/GutQ family sugar-phosphate isomerase [Marinifaba aquimaris]NTS75895.1 KpsF/GutQ family sugar-phosphate isomerase [Marinifaba aquimaris]